MVYGYLLKKSLDEDITLQQNKLIALGVTETFVEFISDLSKKRPQFDILSEKIKADDVLIIWNLGNIGISIKDVANKLIVLLNKDIYINCIRNNLEIPRNMARPAFIALCSILDYRNAVQSEATKTGLTAAIAKGTVVRRRKKLLSLDDIQKREGKNVKIHKIEVKTKKKNKAPITLKDNKKLSESIDYKTAKKHRTKINPDLMHKVLLAKKMIKDHSYLSLDIIFTKLKINNYTYYKYSKIIDNESN